MISARAQNKSVSKPKFMIKAGKYSLLEHVINSLPINKSKVNLISNQIHDNKFFLDNFEIYQIEKTSSQFDSLKNAGNILKNKQIFSFALVIALAF